MLYLLGKETDDAMIKQQYEREDQPEEPRESPLHSDFPIGHYPEPDVMTPI